MMIQRRTRDIFNHSQRGMEQKKHELISIKSDLTLSS